MRLLADIGDFVPLIVGAIAFIGWIANKMREAAGGPAAGAGAGAEAVPAKEGGRVQAEIDRFLQEVRGAVGQRPEANVIEADDAFEAPAQPARQQRRLDQSPPTPKPAPTEKPRSLVDRHAIGQRHIDSQVDDFVAQHLPSQRIGNLVEQDLGHGVEQSVTSHLGSSSGTQVETAAVWEDGVNALSAEYLVGLLSRPEGIRQAVLVQEILSRPKGRRGRRGL